MSKKIIVLIGVAGSGKSTIREQLLAEDPTYQVYSYDELRLEYFEKRTGRQGTPTEAFEFANKRDREFGRYASEKLSRLVKSGVNIIADSTNLSSSRRMKYVNAKYQYGYELHAIVVNTPLDVCIERQEGRGLKAVPEDSIREQFVALDIQDLRRYYASVKWVPDDKGFEAISQCVAGPDFNVYGPQQLKAWVNANRLLVRVSPSKTYPELRVLKYTPDCMFKNLWDYAAIEMRGLVVDKEWNVVVHPFTKLAAEGEPLGILPVIRFPDDLEVEYARKVNGFMAAVTPHAVHGSVFSTTGSLDSNFVDMARDHIDANSKDMPSSGGTATWLFEVCDETDPHIVQERWGATPLAVRVHGQKETLLNTSRALVKDLRDQLLTCRHEGFVVKDPDSGRLVKMKSRYYALIKRIGRTEPQNVNRLVCDIAGLCNTYGEDLMPLYKMLGRGTALNEALNTVKDSKQRVWVLRQAVDQVYSQLGYKDV